MKGSMEQNSIFYHSIERNYRPKGSDIKRVLQVVLLVAICIWLLWQTKNMLSKHESNSQNPQIPSENRIKLLTGKGIVEYINGISEEIQDRNGLEEYERREDGGVGDDELDGHNEDVEYTRPHEQQETQTLNDGEEATNLTNGVAKEKIINAGDEDVHSFNVFHDENGIPPDAFLLVNSTSHKPRGANQAGRIQES